MAGAALGGRESADDHFERGTAGYPALRWPLVSWGRNGSGGCGPGGTRRSPASLEEVAGFPANGFHPIRRHSRHSMRSPGHFSLVRSDMPQRQEAQIVQSQLTLDDSLP